MKKISITGLDARTKAIKGVSYVADAIKSTIGPYGLNFITEKGNKSTNDGYIISSELCPTIEDEFERRAALVAQEACSKTNDMVGDATSTAWALTGEIIKEAVRFLPKQGSIKAAKTPAEIESMIRKGKEDVIAFLEKGITPIKTKEELVKSALVSVENEEIAELLGTMQWELGPEGIIIAEEVIEPVSSIEKVKGIRLDNGFGTSQVINNDEKKMLELANIPVLMTNYTIDTPDLIKLNESIFKGLVSQKKWGIALIARAFTSDAIKACMESMKTGFAIFPINAPYTSQTEMMHDIEAVVGGRYIDTEESSLDDIYISDIGFATTVKARQWDAVIAGVTDDIAEKRIAERAEKLKLKLAGEGSDFMKKMLESRIAQLTNGFAILKVGSQSVTDRKRLKDKCDDAVNAVRLALKGGTIKGAGIALKEASDALDDTNILKRPITCVYDQITGSAPDGWEIPEWVRDPYLVIKCALDNACATAATFSSINGIITSKDKKESKQSDDEE